MNECEDREKKAPDDRQDLTHEAELVRFGGSVLRFGGVIFGLCIALGGWYLSAALGEAFLIGGIALGVVMGGLVFFSGSLMNAILRRHEKK